MKKDANEYLFNEAVKYLGKYPATRKKIKEYLNFRKLNMIPQFFSHSKRKI